MNLLESILTAMQNLKDDPDIKNINEEQAGIEVEKEHEDLYDHLKGKFGDDLDMTLEEFAGWIQKAHNREDKDYYKKLKIMGL